MNIGIAINGSTSKLPITRLYSLRIISRAVGVSNGSSGIYHKPLQTYLDEHDFKYTIISPLLSAKVRKSDIRGTKTDAKDCASIAKVFYLKELRIYSKIDEYTLI